jgi:hypothetical protein
MIDLLGTYYFGYFPFSELFYVSKVTVPLLLLLLQLQLLKRYRPWCILSSILQLIMQTLGRTPWARVQHVARPLATFMSRVGFEPMIPVFERLKTVITSDRAATAIGISIGCCSGKTRENSSRDVDCPSESLEFFDFMEPEMYLKYSQEPHSWHECCPSPNFRVLTDRFLPVRADRSCHNLFDAT